MANEKRLIPDGEKVTLDELPPGTLFAFGDDCIAIKSEYRCSNGLIEAFIIDSGEQFWGGAKTAKEQNALMVQPLAIEEVDAVEVVHGRWLKLSPWNNHTQSCLCLNCDSISYQKKSGVYIGKIPNYCPNCGAKMDGDGNDKSALRQVRKRLRSYSI